MAEWEICTACSAVVADINLHGTWHQVGLGTEVDAFIATDVKANTAPTGTLEETP